MYTLSLAQHSDEQQRLRDTLTVGTALRDTLTARTTLNHTLHAGTYYSHLLYAQHSDTYYRYNSLRPDTIVTYSHSETHLL